MRLLITGADQPLGSLAAAELAGEHELRLTGVSGGTGAGYTQADLREPEQVEPLMEGVQAVLHLAPYAPFPTPTPAAEKEALDTAARGTFVLLHAALKAGAERVVLASRLDLMDAYPPEYVVDETWKPMPDTNATALAPLMAELTLREFVRAESLVGICMRFGNLGPDGTTPEDVVSALRKALTMDLAGRKYRWWLYHVSSTDRYPLAAAAGKPLSFTRTGT